MADCTLGVALQRGARIAFGRTAETRNQMLKPIQIWNVMFNGSEQDARDTITALYRGGYRPTLVDIAENNNVAELRRAYAKRALEMLDREFTAHSPVVESVIRSAA